MAVRQAMSSGARTSTRPPWTRRLPRKPPLSRFMGATPARAAIWWRSTVPSSGSSTISVRATTSPMPGTLLSRSCLAQNTGLRSISLSMARSIRARSASRLRRIVWNERRASGSAGRCRRAAASARASGSGLGSGRTAAAQCAMTPASMASSWRAGQGHRRTCAPGPPAPAGAGPFRDGSLRLRRAMG